MIRIWFIFFLLFFSYLQAISQIRFNKLYDYNSFANYVTDVIVVKAGGYLMVSPSFNPFQNDTLGYSITTLNFIRTDINGDTLWTKQYRKKGYYLLGSNILETDSGFLFMGSETDLKNGTKSYLIQWKLNFMGDTIATKQMNILPGNDYAMEIIKTIDNGYAVIGQACHLVNNCDYYLLKLDSLGNKQWHQTYAQTATTFEYPESLIQMADGSFYLFGTSAISGIGVQFLVKTDSNGQKKWQKKYNNFPQQGGLSILAIDSINLLCIGAYENTNINRITKGMLIKIDTSGTQIWIKSYGDSTSCQFANGTKDINGNVGLTGLMTNFDTLGTYCGCLLKINSAGDSLFQRAYNFGPSFPEALYSIKSTNDWYIMAGYSLAGITQDACLVKVDTFGCLIPGCQTVGIPNIRFNIDPVNIFPNPANEYLNLSHSEKIVSYRMADMLGRIVMESRFLEEPIDIKELKTGAYIIQVMLSNGSQGFGRFVKE